MFERLEIRYLASHLHSVQFQLENDATQLITDSFEFLLDLDRPQSAHIRTLVSKMTPITSLPTELIDQIAGEGLDEDDLLALRLTCRNLNIRIREAHLNAIFNCRRIFLAPASLENLVKISRHPSGSNLRVRKIIVSNCWPYSDLRCDENDEDSGFRITKELEEQSDDYGEELEDFLKHKHYLALLTLAFSNLPQIRTLYFDFHEIRDFSRSEINLYFPSIGFKFGVPSRQNIIDASSTLLADGLEWISLENIWYDIIYTVVSAGLKGIERIEDGGGEYITIKEHHINVNDQYLRKLRSTFSNLKTLHLRMDFWPGGTASKDFKEWMEAIGKNLEDLKIWCEDTQSHEYAASFLPPKTLTKLRRIFLHNFSLPLDKFIKFIDGFRGVESLILDAFGFLDDPLEDWYRLLMHLKKNHHKLREMEFPIKTKIGTTPITVDIKISGSLNSDDARCRLKSKQLPDAAAETYIKRKLESRIGPAEFWGTMEWPQSLP